MASYVTVFPQGTSRPIASNLNFVANETVPNRVIVKVGSTGMVSFFNPVGSVNVVADVGGWFTDATSTAGGSRFVGVAPARILDTRESNGGLPSPLGAGQTIGVMVAGNGGVPAMSDAVPPTAVVLNVTATGGTYQSYLTAWPSGAARPLASDLNFLPNQSVPNLVVVQLGPDGKVDLFNALGSVNVVADVVGWYG
jgi:hypothetical protein